MVEEANFGTWRILEGMIRGIPREYRSMNV
jgi:hypothetical protein